MTMTRDMRFAVVVALLVVSFLLLPQLALPYGRLDWQNFIAAYQQYFQFLPTIFKGP